MIRRGMLPGDADARPLRVLMLPDVREANLYQQLLANAIAAAGAVVQFPYGYRRVLPIWRAVADNQPPPIDLIHLHWPHYFLRDARRIGQLIYMGKFLADLAANQQLRGIGLVWTIHNRLSHESPFPQLELQFRQQLARQADRLILHNQATAAAIAADYQFPLKKASIIPHGHYRSVYAPAIPQAAARQQLGLPTTGRLYLFCGQLRPYKGVERLLALWRDWSDRWPEDRLLVAGHADSEYARTLQQLAADLPRAQLQVRFIPDDELHLYYSAASVAVYPFQQVLNSGSIILAMSYGVPTIAPRLGAIPETLGAADALLYDAEDPQGLQNALLASTQLDLESLARATVCACDRLDWTAIGQQTVAAYRQVLGRSRGLS